MLHSHLQPFSPLLWMHNEGIIQNNTVHHFDLVILIKSQQSILITKYRLQYTAWVMTKHKSLHVLETDKSCRLLFFPPFVQPCSSINYNFTVWKARSSHVTMQTVWKHGQGLHSYLKEGQNFWSTYMKETVKWNLCLRPRKVIKDCPGKLRVVISQ